MGRTRVQVSSSHFQTPQSHLSDHIRSPRANPFVERLPFRAFVDWFWKARKIRCGRAKVPVEKIYTYIATFLVQWIQINVQLKEIHFITSSFLLRQLFRQVKEWNFNERKCNCLGHVLILWPFETELQQQENSISSHSFWKWPRRCRVVAHF